MSLTADELADLRGDIGDDGTVFSDAELNRLYTRAGGDYNTTVMLALRQLLASAAKLHDYQVAQSLERRGQVFDHVKALLGYWESQVEAEAQAQQVQIVGLRAVPPREKREPRA